MHLSHIPQNIIQNKEYFCSEWYIAGYGFCEIVLLYVAGIVDVSSGLQVPYMQLGGVSKRLTSSWNWELLNFPCE